jgi:hypothetical protein
LRSYPSDSLPISSAASDQLLGHPCFDRNQELRGLRLARLLPPSFICSKNRLPVGVIKSTLQPFFGQIHFLVPKVIQYLESKPEAGRSPNHDFKFSHSRVLHLPVTYGFMK